MRIGIHIAAALLISAAFASSASAEPQSLAQDAGVELWQGLRLGMSPDEVVAVLPNIAGVKGGKISDSKGKEPKISVSYANGQQPGVPVGDLRFQFSPITKDGKLAQVMLGAADICGASAQTHFDEIADALNIKYPGMKTVRGDRIDVEALLRESARTGQPANAALMRADKERAVSIMISVTREDISYVPEYGSGKLMNTMARYSNSRNASRLAECNGRGDERAAIVISYMGRDYFDQAIAEEAAAENARQQALRQGL
ncbi:MAG: hypothetical protein J0H88_16310 [Sphingomonadales bacterium]|nr:hypothetical protein [Sphingomonadales bacterium]